MKKLLLLIFVLCLQHVSSAENPDDGKLWKVDWHSSARMAGSTGEYMPFWARTGEDGILPVRSSGLITAGAELSYRNPNGIYVGAGTNLAGAVSRKSPLNDRQVYGLVDRLYMSAGWKMLHLDVGMKPREWEINDLSISGGNFSYSRNARNLPGINAWSDWIYFEKGHWFGIKGNFAHYEMNDNRYVRETMVHNKELAVKVALGRNVDLICGLGRWVQWGGFSPSYGECPDSFSDYIKVIFAGRGGEDASLSDQLNMLGNHLGREYLRIDWRADAFTMTFQYDTPFEDGSGMRLQNVPDGIWTLNFAFNERKAFVTDVIYEFVTTTWQSGTYHDRPATEEEMSKQDPDSFYYGKYVLGGCDNYFNHGEYRSGWTFHGRVLGCPLLLPNAPSEDGICRGMASTRVRAHHFGMKGLAFDKVPYAFKATYSRNYGKYSQTDSSPFVAKPWQLSLALEAEVARSMTGLPVSFSIGVYGDVGKLYQNSAGLSLKVAYGGSRRF
jgi:hypothetical protein